MTGYVHPESLVGTDCLAANLDAPDLRVVDATYYLPMQGKSARAEYEARHIPGALFFDIDEIADETSALPHMLPSPEKFAARMRKLFRSPHQLHLALMPRRAWRHVSVRAEPRHGRRHVRAGGDALPHL